MYLLSNINFFKVDFFQVILLMSHSFRKISDYFLDATFTVSLSGIDRIKMF